ncbi:MAG: hypothetical protein Q9183_002548 [Haloplaca sp. 2 TL-2023]
MKQYKGPAGLSGYDAQAIIIDDSQFYEHGDPPFVSFVSPTTFDLTTQTLSSVSNHALAVGGRIIDLVPHIWSKTGQGVKAYETATINGTAFIVKGFFTGGLQGYYKVWLGHRQSFCSNIFLLPVQGHSIGMSRQRFQRLGVDMVISKGNTKSEFHDDLIPRLPLPSDPSDSVIKSRQRQESTLTIPSLQPLDSIKKAPPEEFDDWIRRLRRHYTASMPQFVQNRGDYEEGDTVTIVKAPAGGKYPEVHPATRHYEAKVGLWSRDLIFWTVTTNSRRYIIASEEKEGWTSYRRWRGTRQGLDSVAFAFKKDITGSQPTGEYLDSYS